MCVLLTVKSNLYCTPLVGAIGNVYTSSFLMCLLGNKRFLSPILLLIDPEIILSFFNGHKLTKLRLSSSCV